MSDLRILVGDRIRSLRKARELTQQQLAELANLDDAYIGSVERGERNISLDTLHKIIVAFDIPPVELFHFNQITEYQLIQQEAVDEYTALINTLTINQIEALRKINKDIVKALQIQ